MRSVDKILLGLGSSFAFAGLVMLIIGIFAFSGSELAFFCVFAGFFIVIGGGFLFFVWKNRMKQRQLLKQGTRFRAKIYGYVEDRSCSVNNSFPLNTKVRYFDLQGVERESILPTGFSKGSGDFPIGATIDIYVLGSSCTWVKGSVRFEHIPYEEELMDNKPINTNELTMIAVTCPSCGASYKAATGYVSTCPYCGHAVNN